MEGTDVNGEWIIPGYRHIRVLGEGASGRVVQAEHLETGTPVAIKYLSRRLVEDEVFLSRFRDEARLLGDLSEPNLVRFYEYVEYPQGAAIVMELVDGVSLAALLELEGPTRPEAALTILKGSLLGLAAAHAAGVVHRDYKPGNVLVRGDGTSMLADFGVAVRAGDAAPAAGTPAYMPPEQWGDGPIGPASDVYAATAVFYECLTGERPYPARTIQQLALAHRTAEIPADRVPQALRGLVEHGLAKNPDDRPASARAFLGELEAVAFGAYGIGWEQRGRDQLKERAAMLALLFPLDGPVDTSATSVGLTELGDDERSAPGGHVMAAGSGRSRGGRKAGMAAAAAALGLLLLAGGTAAVIVGNSGSSSPLAEDTVSPSADPSTDPSGDPSADPSVSPTDSESPSPTPSPTTSSPAPTTSPTTVAGGPRPTPSTVRATRRPTRSATPKPPPFQVTGVSVSVGQPGRNGVGTFTVSVSTTGRPPGTVTLTVGSPNAQLISTPGPLGPGSGYSGSGTYSGSFCRDATINVTASPGGAAGSGSYNAPVC